MGEAIRTINDLMDSYGLKYCTLTLNHVWAIMAIIQTNSMF